eukprot:Seg2308.6 transcript_id=Seg2308.6/GoldUCD/mRNA.D3Y31 product="Transient receptor potential cation channel subfamily M member 6" protein_id=Seg2308.6/GoldUCD/D3Y31
MAQRDGNKWKNFAKKMAAKRDINKRRKNATDSKTGGAVTNDAITIQRLSASVSGKAQKFCRNEPREFVPFGKSDLTLDGIKEACDEHFRRKIGTGFRCDVLAGEQGPSCNSISQIPNLKLIHVRFLRQSNPMEKYTVDDVESDLSDEELLHQRDKRPKKSGTAPKLSLSTEELNKPAFVHNHPPRNIQIPKSISISEMMKLGKAISKELTTINLFTFDFGMQTWSTLPQVIQLSVDEEPFAEGGFRKAFKAKGSCEKFQGHWVVKKYKAETLTSIEELGQTPELQAKRCVQMNCLAQHFAAKFEHNVRENKLDDFGKTFKYNDVYLCQLPSQEYVTIEKFIYGTFEKHINNTGAISSAETVIARKASAFVHFSYEQSQRKLMVVDIQGCGYTLMDPEIATIKRQEDDQYLFCAGNLGSYAIQTFADSHECNTFCKDLQLPLIDN